MAIVRFPVIRNPQSFDGFDLPFAESLLQAPPEEIDGLIRGRKHSDITKALDFLMRFRDIDILRARSIAEATGVQGAIRLVVKAIMAFPKKHLSEDVRWAKEHQS